MIPWLLALGVISYLSSFEGGKDTLRFGVDMGVTAVLALGVYFWALHSRLDPEKAKAYFDETAEEAKEQGEELAGGGDGGGLDGWSWGPIVRATPESRPPVPSRLRWRRQKRMAPVSCIWIRLSFPKAYVPYSRQAPRLPSDRIFFRSAMGRSGLSPL